jgi:hypothetical protein
VQAREEKWRSSSATFHDTARREREAAEKRIEEKLDKQNELLLKLARASNVKDATNESEQLLGSTDERSREPSLWAQLTRELNMDAERHGNHAHEPFDMD